MGINTFKRFEIIAIYLMITLFISVNVLIAIDNQKAYRIFKENERCVNKILNVKEIK